MKTKADLKAIARKVFHLQEGKPLVTPRIMHPEREWAIGLLATLVLVILVGAWSAFTYLDNRNSVDSGLAVEVPETVVYAEASVEEALQIISERNTSITRLQEQNIPTVPEQTTTDATSSATSTATSTESELADDASDPLLDLPEDPDAPPRSGEAPTPELEN